jgi:polar amino acid transport system substrate-binding protein
MKKIILLLVVTLFYSSSSLAAKLFTFRTVDFPPYYGRELPNQGWVSEVVTAALEAQGYRVDIEFMPWTKAVEETKKGDSDALLGAYYTEERADFYYFSAPIAQVRTGLFKRKDDEISFKELKDLKSYKIGVVEGYATSKEFDSADFLTKIPVTNLDVGLKMLYEKSIDLMADSQVVGLFRMKEVLESTIDNISEEIEFIKPVLAMNKIYVAISKKASDADLKLIDFNQGLRKIYLNGTFRKIKKRHKQYMR